MEIATDARYAEKPGALLYERRPDGMADAWLRRNVTREVADMGAEREPVEYWVAEELRLVTGLSREEVAARSDELWAQAEAEGAPTADRLAALEASLEPMPAVYALARMQAATLTDEQALEVPGLYDAWGPDTDYAAGDRRTHGGALYKCLQAHRSQAGWEPGVAPSLWARILPGQDGGVGEWAQPDSTNPYSKGDRVTHKGKTWESLVDGNVWEPGAHGTAALWHEVS